MLDSSDRNPHSDFLSEYNHESECDRSIADFTKAIDLDPDSSYAYWSRALACVEKGEYDKAIADYKMLLSLLTDDPVLIKSATQAIRELECK